MHILFNVSKKNKQTKKNPEKAEPVMSTHLCFCLFVYDALEKLSIFGLKEAQG